MMTQVLPCTRAFTVSCVTCVGMLSCCAAVTSALSVTQTER